ncbi:MULTISPECIES: YegP family protein [unclassified Arthrobacter]|uniref:YegP family protein n=1 Tax=unclassified Arthrobacter TaxID=235627 RepID=UPI001CFF75B1|nr:MULTISPECIES: YegP family protein [unclassified Arthrobacter]MDN4644598.1 YegP family protein [Arthrobacter sp. PsM3]
MAGIFEIAEAGGKKYFFKLTAPDGTVVAVSPLFNTIKGAAAGITAVRENAATGLIVDKSRRVPDFPPQPSSRLQASTSSRLVRSHGTAHPS